MPAGSRTIALTFDDGPHPQYTPAVLRLLAKLGIRATFFVVGQNVVRYPALVHDIADEGHTLGGHTFTHREITSLSALQLERELDTCRHAIQEAAKVDTVWLRPPRGRISLSSLRHASLLGYRIVHWTRTYGDYQHDGAPALAHRMIRDGARPRDIVLLHDHNPDTVEALSTAIPLWRSRGVGFQAL